MKKCSKCSKCGTDKPLDAYYFEKGKPRASCKECHKAKVYERSPERIREINAKYHAKHPEKIKARRKEYWAANADEINAERRQARADNPDHFREQKRSWWAANRDRIAEQRRASYAANREARKQALRDYRAAHPEKHREWERRKREVHAVKIRARHKAYYAANPEIFHKHRRKREARLAEVEWQPYTRREIYDRDGGMCRICAVELPFEPRAFQLDHIVPISLGGPDTPANLQLTCPPCNRAKWANLEGQIHLPV